MSDPWYRRLFGGGPREGSVDVQAAAGDRTNLTIEELAKLYGVLPDGGIAVTPESALQSSTVYGCVELIAGAVTSLPIPVYERQQDDSPKSVEHDMWWLLNERPHPTMSAATFWEYIVASMLLRGDGFAEIIRKASSTNEIRYLYPLHPDRVKVTLTTDKVLKYQITDMKGLPVRDIAAADILHFPTLGFNGERSPSRITLAGASAVGIALTSDEHAKSFFRNRARPDVVLSSEKRLDEEQIKLLRTSWMAAYGGPTKSGMPAVIGGGMKLEPITVSASDAQLLESRKFSVEEICRIFGVPPFMLGHTEKTTSWGQGVDNMGRGFVKFTLRRYLEKIEQELNYKFWPRREKYFVEFVTAGLEQGDYKTRMDGYRQALGRAGEPGWMTVNEVRRLENLPKKDGGDELNTGQTPEGTGNEGTAQGTGAQP